MPVTVKSFDVMHWKIIKEKNEICHARLFGDHPITRTLLDYVKLNASIRTLVT